MTISFEEINRVTARVVCQPILERELRAIGVRLPTPWEPTDEELEKLIRAFNRAMSEVYGEGREEG